MTCCLGYSLTYAQTGNTDQDSLNNHYLDSLYYLAEDYVSTNGDSTVYYSKLMLDSATALKDTINIAWAEWELGVGFFNINLLDSSKLHYEIALELFTYLGDSNQIAYLYTYLGEVYQFEGQYHKAIELYEIADALCKKLECDDGGAYTYNCLGNIYLEQDKPKSALRYFREALTKAVQYNQDYMLGSCYNNLGIAFTKLDQLKNAKIYLDKAFVSNADDLLGFGYTLSYLAELMAKQNQLDSAQKLSRKALQSFKEYADPYSVAYEYNGLAKIQMQAELYDQALASAQSAYNMSVEEKSRFLIKESSLTLSKAYENKNLFDKALKHFITYKAYNDTITSINLEQKLIERKAKIQERENLLLKTQNELQEELNKRNYHISIGAITLLILSIIFAYYVFINSRKHKAQNKALLISEREIKSQQTKINAQNKELEKQNRAKDRLFSILSHDLKEPYNQVSGLLDLLKLDALSQKEKDELIGKLQEALKTTSNSLENLLHWSKNQLSGFITDIKKVKILPIIENIKGQNLVSLSQKELNLEVHIKDTEYVLADINQLEIILRNLLTNAIKYSKVRGTIALSSEVTEESLYIHVKDNGTGINESKLRELRAIDNYTSTPGTLEEKGTGLGLIIIQEFIKANNGYLDMESTEGKGSTFTVVLPKA